MVSYGIFLAVLVLIASPLASSSASEEQMQRKTQQDWLASLSMCGCQQCTSAVYNSQAGNYKCIDRILFLIGQGMTEENACLHVGNEFPTVCGPACNPQQCDGRAQDPQPLPVSATVLDATFCDCPHCTHRVWSRQAGSYSCGARIQYLEQVEQIEPRAACYQVSLEHPFECGMCNPHTCAPPPQPIPVSAVAPSSKCGCSQCTPNVLNADADGHTCSERIDFLVSSQSDFYPTEEDACRQIGQEFPSECGLCTCNPVAVVGRPLPLTASVSLPAHPHAPPTELYCYPPTPQRTIYNDVWGKYTLEVKEGDSCGPSDNLFSKEGVALDNTKSELTLSFGKQTDGQWYASEVRVLLPRHDHYDYGRYSFSVKSIQVKDTLTGDVVSTALPPSMILGLFTWDATENYNLRQQEAWMHEVDIELSQWDVASNADVQFLVQPPGSPYGTHPHKHRFFSGMGGTPTAPVFHQAPHTYDFDWKPAEITWHSSAGGGQSFTYNSQAALDAHQPDYLQCLPANVEVRINLWHLHGSSPVAGMQDHERLDVVIDNFTYVPSGLTGVPEGGVCSKDCHCGGAPFSCINNQCTHSGSRRRRRMGLTGFGVGDDEESGYSVLSLAALAMSVSLTLAMVVVVLRRRRHTSLNDIPGTSGALQSIDDEADADYLNTALMGPLP